MNLRYFPQDLVYQKASEFLLRSLEDHVSKKTLLFLSGGSAVKLYERIKNYELGIRKLAIAQVDERFQPENKEDINTAAIEKTGLFDVCRKKKIPYYLVSQTGTLQESAEEYNQTISKLFKEYQFKIGILGIGEDGHTAGLLPGYEKVWNIDKHVVGYVIDNHRQNTTAEYFCPQKFRQRITVTPKALQQLDHAVVVAVGENKREALRRINDMKIKDINKFPAAILQKIKKVDLFTDIKTKG